MEWVVNAGGYGKGGFGQHLATPRASQMLNVYGLSVDVFVFRWRKCGDLNGNCIGRAAS